MSAIRLYVNDAKGVKTKSKYFENFYTMVKDDRTKQKISIYFTTKLVIISSITFFSQF